MSAGWAGPITFFGLLLALGGVGCGVWAYVVTVREHDDLPVWPWAHRQAQRALSLFRRRTVEAAAQLSAHGSVVATASATASALTVGRGDETLEERVALLQERLERVQRDVVQIRPEVQQHVDKLTARIMEQGDRLAVADEQIRALARSVAVSSARLQLVGLILVGLGTALMAIPAIASAL